MRSVLRRIVLVGFVVSLVTGPVLAAPAVVAGSSLTSADSAPASPLGQASKWLALSAGVVGITIRKDLGSIAKKFVARASAASGDYASGVSAAGADWEANTKASESNYEQGVQAGIARKAFGKGVASAGQQKFVERAKGLGAQRFGPGVQASEAAYNKGMAPVLATLSSLQLPVKGPKRSPQNQQRSAAVAVALGALKVGS